MRNFTFNRSKIFRFTFLIAFLLLSTYNASAQFYTKHYIAPAPWQYFSKSNEIVIATNSTSTVTITVTKSDGTAITSLSAIKGTPAIYRFPLLAKDLPMNPLNTVLNAAGLIVTSTGPTSINLRNIASDENSGENNDAYLKGNAALTSFGDAGIGVRFRVGYYRDGSLGNFNNYGDQRPIYSIMATVNNTTVKINNVITATLNAGQSYLFKAPIGTLVESSNPAVMNTAAAIDTPGGCGDSAYNQIPPEAVLGTEYFIERGTGNDIAEQTTVVATKDNTSLTINAYSPTGTLVSTTPVTLALAGDFYTFLNGTSTANFSASRVAADKRVAVYSGTAQSCEVDISTIAPVSECGGSNFIETAKFRDYGTGTLKYFGYILLRSATEVVTVNGTNIETISGIAARHQLGTTGWYLINFNDTQIGAPNVLSLASNAKLTVSIVQQDGGFSMAGFFSTFAAQPEDPTLTYIAGGGCTNNKADLTTPAGFAPYQWYFNGTAITGANSPTYTATKTGSYSVSSTLACGAQTPSKPVSVTLCTDLGITKTVDNTSPCLGSNVEFTVKVSNLGGNNVSGISATDLLPSGYTYVSSTPSVGSYDSGTGVWSMGDLDAGAVLTLKIIATVNSSGSYTNTASLPSDVDTNTANNSASAAVNPKSSNFVVTNPAAVCAPSTVDITAPAITAGSTSNLTLSYWTDASATTTPYTTPTTAAAGTYYIKATSADGCVFIKPVVVTVNAQANTPSISVVSGSTSCSTGNVVLRSSGNSGTFLWSTGETTKDITVTTAGSYTVKRINAAGCAGNSSPATVVTFTPVAPTASAQTFCSSENKKVSDLVATGTGLKWYSASTGGTALAATQVLTSTTYYVSQTVNACESARTSVAVTINTLSSAPVASPQTFCAADNKIVNNLIASGTSKKWYNAASGGTLYAGTETLVNGNYYVSQTANSCGESARTLVVVTINSVPAAPTASSQTFCATDGKKVSDLVATGTGLKWYSANTGGTLYNGTEVLVNASYYVSQTTNTCGESPRTLVAVTVNNTAAPTASSQTFCGTDAKTVNDLVATGSNKKWYSASTGGTLYAATDILSTGSYYVSQTLNSCESTRTLVAVTVNNTAAPTASSQTFCFADNKKVSNLTATGTALKWYSTNTGGTAYTGTETLSSQNYYVSQTLNSCESPRTLVSVTVNPTPAAPTITAGGPTSFCPGGSVVLTSSGGTTYLWSTGATTQSITVSSTGNYSVQVTNASGCPSAASTPTAVTVNPTPTAPVVTVTQPTCATATGTITVTVQNAGETYSFDNGGSFQASNSKTGIATGNYNVIIKSTTGCNSAATPATVNTQPSTPTTPTITAGGPTAFCPGGSVTLTSSTGTSYLWSTGAITQSITVSTAGSYSVQITNASGCQSAASASTTVTVNPTPTTPTITAGGPITFCPGGSVTLTSSTGTSYLWSTGAITQSITVSTAGSYSVQITNASGCQSAASASTTVTVNPTPTTPTITAGGPITFCPGGSVTLTSSTGTSYLWSTGAITQSITVSTAGSYSVQITNASGCQSAASASTTVTVNPTPTTPTITAGGPITFCPGGSVTLTSSTGTSYLWSTGAITQSITVSTAGSYSVQITNASGCQSAASASTTVTVNPTPTTPTITAGGPTTFCPGGSVTLTSSTGTSYLWSTGAITQSITVSTAGSYSVQITNASGCQSAASASTTVTVNPTPTTPTITAGGPTTFCPGGSVTLTSSTGTSYLWSTGAITQSITVSTAGSYSVQITNASGCQSAASASTTVTVNPTPTTPTITAGGPTTFCPGGSVTLTSSTGTSYLWSTGAITQSITVSTAGSYSVQITNASGCQSAASASTTVTVNPTPTTPTITAGGPTAFCPGGSVTLTSSTGTSYLWSTGAITQSITVSTAGSYSVQITNASGCQSAASASTTVTVNPTPATPTITAGGPTTFCPGGSVTLTSSTGTSYLWSTGAITQSITVSTAGSYSVQITNASGCQSAASASTTVTVNPTPTTPTITAGGPTAFCPGGSVTLTSSTGTSYLWSTGAITQSITVSTAGSYSVQITNASGCQSAASASTTVTVNPTPATPTITAGGPTAFCPGGSVTLTSSTGTSYLWSTGAITQSITVSTAGSYSVQITNASGCQSAASASTTVTVNPTPTTPTITAGGPTTFCPGGSVTLTSSAGTSYLWSTGAITQSITVSTAGSYSVQITNASGCQSAASASTTVTVNPTPTTPTITAGGPTTFCPGGSVTLTSSAGTSYLWSTGAITQSITVSTAGSYSVQITNASGCQSAASASTTITVNPTPTTPTITAGGPTTFCPGGSVTLTSSTGTSYLWSTGAITQSITVSTAGSYSVQITNASGCQSAASAATTVTVSPTPATPTITAGSITTFCPGGSVVLTSSAATSYLWSTGATTQSITVSATGNYSVQVTNASGCPSAASAATTVTVSPTPATPTITAGSITTFCPGGSVVLTSSAATSYLWSTGATTQSITVSTAGSYSVQITNASGCQSAASASTTVTVNPTPTTPTITAGGPTTFCPGGSVTLTSSTGTSYLWSTGAITQSITVSTAGSYSVQITNASGCQSAASASTTVTVNPTPTTPTITAGGPTTFCPGGSVTLTSSTGTSYLWSTGAITQSITVSTAGSYSVQITNASGCQSAASASTTVTVNPTPTTPTITAGGPTTFCPGGSVTLTSSTGTSYLWSTGAITQSITVSTAGSYSVQITNASGCQSAASASTTVTVNPTPTTPTITAGGPTTFCPGGSVTLTSSTGTSYLWSTGAITQSITVSTAGSYSVQITNASGCQSAASASTTVTVNPTPSAPVINITQPTCATATGTITVTVQNTGETYSFDNGGNFQSSNSKIGIATGSYNVIIKSATGCNSVATLATVNTQPSTPVKPILNITSEPVCSNTTGSFTITNYNASYTYTITPSSGVIQNGDIVTAPSGNYNVIATLGSCSSITSVDVTLWGSICAVAENLTPSINGNTGGTTTSSLTAGDTLNGTPIVIGTNPGEVTLTGVNLPTGITINADGTVSVAVNTAAGTYDVEYKICEVTNPTNCDSAISTLTVTAPVIDAVAETLSPSIVGITGGTTTTSLTAGDTLNGTPIVIGTNPGEVTLTGVNLPTGITINTNGTVSVAANTAAGTYDVEYKICEVTNPTNCDSAISTLTVTAPVIDAVADALTPSLNGITGGTTTTSLIEADTLNGTPAVIGTNPGEVTLTGVNLPTGITINTNGTVSVAANTAAGTYDVEYKICEVTNPTNCDSAISTLTVTAPVIDAVADALTPSLNGITGGTTTTSLIEADTLNGTPAVIGTNPGEVTLTGVNLPTGITINADGTVSVAANTAAGTYDVEYKICEVTNPTNCDSAISTLTVTAPVIDAVADALTPSLNGITGGTTTTSLIEADTLNGTPAVIGTNPGEVTLTGVNLPTGITINTNGTVSVAANTAAGTYDVEYKICEVTNPTNCDSAISTLTVTAPVIDAVADALTPSLNGITGGTTTTSLIEADTLNGTPAVIGTNPGEVTLTGVNLPTGITINADGTVSVAANTAAGTYDVEYKICEVTNPTNCDSAISTLTVTAPVIDAVADALTPSLNGITGGTTTTSLIEADTLNGTPAVIGTNPGEVTLTGVNLPTGITINTNGTVSVAANTAAGTYDVEYKICEVTNPTNCDSAISTLTVTAPVIDAVADALTPSLNGITGGTTTTSLIEADTLNGTPAVIGTNPGEVTLTGVNLPTGITINTNGTVSVAANTAAGTYDVEYKICEVTNPTNCDTATSTVIVMPVIDAVADALTPSLNGITGGTTTTSLITNDTLNGNPAVIGTAQGEVTIAGINLPTGITINTDGTVSVAANTAAGTYNVTYTICEVTNPTNCDTATSTVIVMPVIDAVADALAPSLNGITGGTTTTSLITNDTLNGSAAVIGTNPGEVTLTGINLPTGITINTDGTVSVAANTAAGTYNVTYTICEVTNPTNCDTATSTVIVMPVIDAVADALTPSLNGITGGTTTTSLITNDTLNGNPAVIGTAQGEVTLTGINLPTGITINTDGTVSVAANTAAGTYNVTYTICEVTNPTNCDTATSTVIVMPVIDAVADALTPSLNGITGGTTTTSLIAADTLNGSAAVIGTAQGEVTIAGINLPTGITINTDGTVSVAANTAAGTYNVTYTICEVTNPTNCDTATSTVIVMPVIDAVADALTPSLNGITGGTTTTSLITNDTLNGNPAVIGTAQGEVTLTGINLPTGITINTDGTVSVAANTAAGTYNVTYTICEVTNPTNCDSAISTLTVTAPIIDAVAETTDSVNGTTGGTTGTSVIEHDTLNAIAAVIGTSAGEVTLTGINLPTGFTLNADGTVSVAAGTAAGSYEIQYSICEVTNPTNCDTAKSIVPVTVTGSTPAVLVLVDDTANSVVASNVPTTVLNVLGNDTKDGLPIVSTDVSLSETVADPTGNITLNPDGSIILTPNAPAGTYTLTYQVCELNTTNCATATVQITVVAPVIDAVAETTDSVNGTTGGTTGTSVIEHDTLNGIAAVIGTSAGEVTLTGINLPTGFTLNADGTVSVAAGTAAGSYEIQYSICEVTNPTNCDTAKSIVPVTVTGSIPAVLVLVDDTANSVVASNVPTTVLNVLGNDTKDGLPIVSTDVSLSETVADPTGNITLNPDGSITLKPNAPAGTYTLTYQVCELNTTNCATATVQITVVAPVIDAVAETTDSVNGTTGGTTGTSVIEHDTLNGIAAVIGTSAGEVTLTGINLPTGFTLNADGTVSVAAGTAAGSYEIQYSICEVTNPTNCDTAKSIVPVTVTGSIPAVLVLVDDTANSVVASNVPTTILNVLGNDTKDGLPIVSTDVSLSETVADPTGNITLNPDGSIILTPNAPAGTYTLTYQVCELNTTNCATATVQITVVAPVIDAVAETTDSVNGTTGGTTGTSVIEHDTLNGIAAVIGTSAGEVTLTGINLPTGFTLNADGTVSVAAGTAAGSYEIQYSICEVTNPTNCDTAKSIVPVTVTGSIPAVLVLVDDTANSVVASNVPTTVLNVLGNDTKDGLPIVSTDVSLSETVADPTGNITLNPDGSITLKPNAPAGTYTLTYQVCELNTTNCATATVQITVVAPVIDAVAETTDSVNGTTGGTTGTSVIEHDTLNGIAAVIGTSAGEVTLTGINLPTGFTLNADGTVSVAAGTAAGSYEIQYSICEVTNPTNCDTAKSIVPVTVTGSIPAVLVLVDDTANSVVASNVPTTVLNVLGNDTKDGLPIVSTDVSLSETVADPTGNITLNPDGSITLKPNAPAGTYTLTYQVCELNTTNCATATVQITVVAPVIDAVAETTDSVNGTTGGTTGTSVIEHDTLNGIAAVIGTSAGEVTLTGINLPTGFTLNADGTVSVAAGTAAGSYEIQYSICEVTNPTNCDTAKSIVPVTVTGSIPAVLVLVDDTANSVVASNVPTTILNVLGNDTKDGLPIVSTDVSLSETVADPTGNITLNPDGSIILTPNAPAGTYTLTYQVCELNTTNCATATVQITVVAPVIDAVAETTDSVNGTTGGTTGTSVIEHDTLNGIAAVIGTSAGEVTLTGINLPTGFTLNADGTVSVAAGTAAGSYEIQYSICEVTNPTNCDTAKSIVPVTVTGSIPAVLVLVDDTANSVVASNVPTTVLNVLGNDTKDGLPIVSTDVSLSETVADPTGNITLNPDGSITLKPNAPAGTYTLTYQVCELNTTNCATATVQITVVAPVIDAVAETTDSVNGTTGGTTGTSVIEHDTLNGIAAVIGTSAGEVTLTGINLPTGFTLNADGTVSVAAGTAAGSYEIQYSICEVTNPTNCDTAKSIVPVTVTGSIPAVLVLVDDTANSVVASNVPTTVLNVLGNDTKDGLPIVSTDVSLSETVADPTGNITLNPDGSIILTPNAPAGTYTLTYQVCELNTTNCATATVQITVVAPVIDAVAETTDSVNGTTGGTTSTSVIEHDTLNGIAAVIGTSAGEVTLTGINLPTGFTLNADGTVSVAAGTAAGSYEIQYSICEVTNPTNCDTAKSIVPVTVTGSTPAVLVLVDDTANSVVASNVPTTVLNVLGNDTKDGLPIVSTDVSLSETVADPTGNITLNPDGSIILTPNAPAGTYTLTYQVCELNTTNCATATVQITVVAPVIDAVAETTDSVNGTTGGTTGTSVIEHDTLNGIAAVIGTSAGEVTLTGINLPTGFTLNADGTVSVAAGTAAGSYEIQYSICEVTNPTNCDTAKSIVPVTVTGSIPAVLVLVDDTANSVVASNVPTTVLNVLGNDTKDGLPIVSTDVSLSETVADPTGNITLNPDGSITLKPNAPAGTYTLTYQVCELNTTNCATATVQITVVAPVIDAVAETTDSVNGTTGGTTGTSVIEHDTLNAIAAVIGTSAGEVTLTGINLPTGFTLNADGTVSVAAGTAAGSYEIQYSICEVTNPTNCDTAKSIVPVTVTGSIPAVLVLVDDTANSVVASNVPTTILNVLGNDTKDGLPIVSTDVSLSETVADPTGNITLNPDGSIILTPNAPAGTYTLTYQVCELNTTNCATATVQITVVAPVIDAVAETTDSVNGTTGGTTGTSVIEHDTLNGIAAVIGTSAGEVTLTGINLPTGFTLNADGTVSVAAGTAAGSYEIQYSICEVTNPTNCDTAKSIVPVTVTGSIPAVLVLVDDTANSVVASNVPTTVLNVLGNDTKDGLPIVSTDVSLSETVADPTGNITLNPDGSITLKPNAPAGTYTLTYQVCELNTTNCATATVQITVVAPVIDAVAETTDSVNGTTGGTTSTSVIEHDTLNGIAAVIGTSAGEVTLTGINLPTGFTLNADGTVSVAAGTAAGSYEIQYSICEVTNPTNCDTAKSIVPVTVTGSIPAVLVLVDDTANSVVASNVPTTVLNVLGNDTKDGLPIVSTDVSLSETVADPTGNITLNPDGSIILTPNAPAGTYTLTYQVCELNTTNCATATVQITVVAPVIDAVAETTDSVNGTTGGTTSTSVIEHDTLNGIAAVIGTSAGEVTLTGINLPTGFTLNADGTVSVAAGTAAGSYEIQYSICEVTNPTNCDTAKSIVPVTVTGSIPAVLVLVDDTANSVVASNVPTTVLNVLGNDTKDGLPIVSTDVSLSETVADPTGNITLNPDGSIILTPNAPAGTYTLTYQVCELNTTNCATATVTITVIAPPAFIIKANDDTTGPIDSSKEVNTSLNVFNNDTLNGVLLNPADVVLTTVIPNPSLILNADGSVDVKANTPSGTYELTYQICDALHTSNCSQAIVKVTVLNSEPPVTPITPIVLTNDSASVDGINGQLEFINVLNNDLLNGLPINPVDIVFTNITTSPYFEFNSDGTVNVKPNTPGGNYPLVYQVCEKANPTNCNTATLNVFVEVPAIAIIKTATFNDENGNGSAEIGETITYNFKVTNTGNVPLIKVMVTDPLPGIMVSGQEIELAVDESNDTNFTALYKITQADINQGSVSNQATVTAVNDKRIVVEDLSDKENNIENRPTVLALNGCVIKVFNAFSPNGDAKNSRFYIQGLECYPDNTVEIYNRWGVLVYDTDHYNNQDRVFVGVSEGRATVKQSDGLPVGTYFYILKYRDNASVQHEMSGYVYINK